MCTVQYHINSRGSYGPGMMLLGWVEGIISQTLHPSHVDANVPCLGVVP